MSDTVKDLQGARDSTRFVGQIGLVGVSGLTLLLAIHPFGTTELYDDGFEWGTFILVWCEADEVLKIFEILTTSTDEDAAWMRGRIEEIGGIELAGPPPGPAPELILEWPAAA